MWCIHFLGSPVNYFIAVIYQAQEYLVYMDHKAIPRR
jgi:hypothetical protein